MINRALLRNKVIQILYSYYKNNAESLDFDEAKNELAISIEKTYELYHYLLQTIVNITSYATTRLERSSKRSADLQLLTKLSNNKFALQLAKNKDLLKFIEEHDLDWPTEDCEITKTLYKEIAQVPEVIAYCEKEESTYEEDREIWRFIVKKTFSSCELLGKELEDLCIYWNDDAEVILSFVLKTIRKFEAEKSDEQELIPQFRDKEDEEFAYTLLKNSIYNEYEYREMVKKHTHNWDSDRIAFMDTIIMQAAIAEICSFPSIPVNVTMNEFIEIAKNYSTPKSGTFINGILDAIVKELKAENKLTKATYVNSYKK